MASPSAYVGIEEGYNRGLSCDYVVQGRRVKDLPLGRITKIGRPWRVCQGLMTKAGWATSPAQIG
jgi:hypothetical protein